MFRPQSSAEERRKDKLNNLDSSLGDIYKEKMALKERMKALDEMEKGILRDRKRIVNLHLAQNGQDLLEDEREIVVSDLINACSENADKRFSENYRKYSSVALSQSVIKALKECYEYDITHEFVSAVLFIFGLMGSEIDFDNIKNLDPENPKDRDMIERISVYLNDETDFAIDTCMDMVPEREKNELFHDRIEKIERVMFDFKGVKRKYDKYIAQIKKEKKEFYKKAREQAILKNDKKETGIPGENRKAA